MRILPFCLLAILSYGCRNQDQNNLLTYSTKSDSAIFYCQKGWEEIMDFGQYAQAVITNRKALSFDSDFLLGKSILTRLT